jgi:hypothetical protein
MYLFSYGSNHPGQLAQRLGHPVMTLSAIVKGYQRVFRGSSRTWGGGGVASLLKRPGGLTFGLAIVVSPRDLEVLDRYEGVPYAYRRQKLQVLIGDAQTPSRGLAYIAESPTFNAPSRAYLEAVAKTVSTHWAHDDGTPIDPEDFPIR